MHAVFAFTLRNVLNKGSQHCGNTEQSSVLACDFREVRDVIVVRIVDHRLQEVEEEGKVAEGRAGNRKGESRARRDAHEDDHAHGDGMKDSNLSQSACVRKDEDTTTLPERMRTTLSGSGQWCMHRAVPRNHR